MATSGSRTSVHRREPTGRHASPAARRGRRSGRRRALGHVGRAPERLVAGQHEVVGDGAAVELLGAEVRHVGDMDPVALHPRESGAVRRPHGAGESRGGWRGRVEHAHRPDPSAGTLGKVGEIQPLLRRADALRPREERHPVARARDLALRDLPSLSRAVAEPRARAAPAFEPVDDRHAVEEEAIVEGEKAIVPDPRRLAVARHDPGLRPPREAIRVRPGDVVLDLVAAIPPLAAVVHHRPEPVRDPAPVRGDHRIDRARGQEEVAGGLDRRPEAWHRVADPAAVRPHPHEVLVLERDDRPVVGHRRRRVRRLRRPVGGERALSSAVRRREPEVAVGGVDDAARVGVRRGERDGQQGARHDGEQAPHRGGGTTDHGRYLGGGARTALHMPFKARSMQLVGSAADRTGRRSACQCGWPNRPGRGNRMSKTHVGRANPGGGHRLLRASYPREAGRAASRATRGWRGPAGSRARRVAACGRPRTPGAPRRRCRARRGPA